MALAVKQQHSKERGGKCPHSLSACCFLSFLCFFSFLALALALAAAAPSAGDSSAAAAESADAARRFAAGGTSTASSLTAAAAAAAVAPAPAVRLSVRLRLWPLVFEAVDTSTDAPRLLRRGVAPVGRNSVSSTFSCAAVSDGSCSDGQDTQNAPNSAPVAAAAEAGVPAPHKHVISTHRQPARRPRIQEAGHSRRDLVARQRPRSSRVDGVHLVRLRLAQQSTVTGA